MLVEPLTPIDAKRLIGAILDEGSVTFSSRALKDLEKDDLTTVDAVKCCGAASSSLVNSRTALGDTA